ncbi:MAG: ion transporter [Pseudomonadales bacterium]|jgi:voltage-gated potassium channel|nr:ion transporter [Pseudomonadales bacterium]
MVWTKDSVRTVIFEAGTPAGKAFDMAVIVLILLSVGAIMLDSVDAINAVYGDWLYVAEWVFTLLFTVEYALRLWCIQNTWRYARSFYGVIDLICILPTYLSLWFAGSQYFLVIRVLRVLRIFRVLRMVRYVGEAELITQALVASRRKITVFVASVLCLVVIFGSLMYLIEGGRGGGFSSIPNSIYWAVSTMTTVGYGDITPQTPLGRALATVIMIMGYGIIAVPTGIVTLELNEANRRAANTRTCPHCSAEGHLREASYCWRCGEHLYRESATN